MRLITRIICMTFVVMLLFVIVSDCRGSSDAPADNSREAASQITSLRDIREARRSWLIGVIVPSVTALAAVILLLLKRIRAGKHLKNSTEHFDIAWKNSESSIIVIDSESRVVLDANPVAIDMFGVSREKTLGNRYEELLDLNEDRKNRILTAERASHEKSVFLANMSHEMRTPLNVVVGLTGLMMEETTSPEIKENLRKINIAGNDMMSIISDVLDISNIEAGKLALSAVTYDVAHMLNDVVTSNITDIESGAVVFEIDISEDLPCYLYGDDLRVKQILNNLLSNAVKYTKAGKVTMGVSCAREEYENVWMSAYVSDTGIGMREADMKKLFIDYNQVDIRANRMVEGTGLGLGVTKKLVELMGGEINAETVYGKGTTFRLRIRQRFVDDRIFGPETAENLRNFSYFEKKKRVQEKLVRPNLSYLRVLVVDDFRTNLDVTASMLLKYKMKVDCVTSGQEAIDLMERGTPVFNAIFMDHIMPEMDGIETTARIRGLGTKYAKTIPIIALTANAIAGSRQIFLNNGFQEFLPKPVSVLDLDSVIYRWIRDESKE